MNTLVRTVDLVDYDDNAMPELQCTAQHKTRLRHGAFRSINQQDNAVDHFQDAFHFPAEIGMPRGINNIDFGIAVPYGCILRHDRNAAFPFQIIGIHYAVHYFLIFSVYARLLQHFVDKGGLSVVNVGNDGYISQLVHEYSLSFLQLLRQKCILPLEERKRN